MQFIFLRHIRAHVVFLFVTMILFTIGCEDKHNDEDHTDADGFVLENESGAVEYKEFEGAMYGTITLAVGDTLELSVYFLDHEENKIDHEEDEEDELSVSENDSTIAVVEAEAHDHEEEHGIAIHVIGISSGSTSFQLQLMHEGHADYTSTNNVPVIVN